MDNTDLIFSDRSGMINPRSGFCFGFFRNGQYSEMNFERCNLFLGRYIPDPSLFVIDEEFMYGDF